MTLHDEVGFSTGTYPVERANAGTWVAGRYERATPTLITVDADVQPASGDSLEDLPEGMTASDRRTVFTSSPLYVARPNLEADVMTVESDRWRVVKVEHFTVISGHYRATIERLRTAP